MLTWKRRMWASFADGEDLNVFDVVTRALGISLPKSIDATTVDGFCAETGCFSHEVQVDDRWWHEDFGPLIGRKAVSGGLVALVYKRGRYRMIDPRSDGRAHTVDREIAESLEPTFDKVYFPLPDDHASTRKLVAFGLRGSGTDLARFALLTVVGAVISLVVPVCSGLVVGEFLPAGNAALAVEACVAMILAAMAVAGVGMLSSVAMTRVQGRFEATLQAAVWNRLLRLPTAFFRRSTTGEIADSGLGVMFVRETMAKTAVVATQSGTFALANVVVMATIKANITLVALGVVLVDLAVFAVVAFRQVILNARALSIRYRLNDDVYQWLRALPKVRTAAAEPFVFGRWLARTGQVQSLRSRSDRIQDVVSAFGTAAVTASVLLAYYLLSGPMRGDLDNAELVSWVAAYAGLLAAVLQLGGLSGNIGIMVSVKRRLNPLLESKTEDYAQGAALPPRGDICFDHVSFSYAVDDVPAVQDISFRVRPGEFVAIVGPSGCGKSTLLRLLLGFESPASGRITVGGQELADITMPGLRRQCGVVFQDALPFAGTIFDNIQGSGHLTWSQAWAAARSAGLEEDIRRMPMGMSTVLADGGAGLSGGQRQRLMLAQALAKQPAIVVLDEATSALDNRAQDLVSASIGALRVTRIVVAHRLSTVMTADRVLVMRDGRIVEEGSPESLIKAEHGEFRELVRHQLGS